jgi:hypothetical protein
MLALLAALALPVAPLRLSRKAPSTRSTLTPASIAVLALRFAPLALPRRLNFLKEPSGRFDRAVFFQKNLHFFSKSP